jgi:hypothetical protein
MSRNAAARRHLEADVEALDHAELLHDVGERLRVDVDGARGAHLLASASR